MLRPCAAASSPVPSPPHPASSVTRAQYLMGTVCEMTAFGSEGAQTVAALSEAFAEIARLEEVMSNYRDHSELVALNRQASQHPVRCSEDLFAVLAASVHYSRLTQGAFDVTVAPLMQTWHIARTGRWPQTVDLAQALAVVGSDALGLSPETREVRFLKAGMAVDLGGIGKGYALDAAANVLRRRGITSALMNFGGELYALGAPPGQPAWELTIADPRDERRTAVRLWVADRAVSTSAQTQRFMAIEGKRIGHIIDPHTGQPVSWEGSVTVVAADGTTADALSTGLFVLGVREGLGLANRLPEVGAIFLEPAHQGHQLKVTMSRGCTQLKMRPAKNFLKEERT
ncbi:MAG: FAD:protein FMN transferase [Elusimicrobia bacterium]|nr:FAD:protein FMN transferase [Elusimicrobiota bacterium]